MQIAIVDDEIIWRQKIEKCLKKIVDKNDNIETFSSAEEFLNNKKKYDITFMDVEMDKIDGFEATKMYKDKYTDSVVAMLTTHDEMCGRGYMVEAFRYISKMDMTDGMQEALFSLKRILEDNKLIEVNVLSQGKYKIKIKNIIYVETYGRHTLIHMNGKIIECTDTMKEMCEKLEGNMFFKTHQSFLVNMDYVLDCGKDEIVLKTKEKVMLSKRQRKAFEEAFFKKIFQCANR